MKDIVVSGQKHSARQLKKETANEQRYIRDGNKLILKAGVLYRKLETEGQETHQLVVPSSVKDIVLTAMHDDMGHQGRDRMLVSQARKTNVARPGLEPRVSRLPCKHSNR